MLLTYLLCFLVTVIKVAVCESIQITVPCNGDEYEAGHAMLIEW
jgi:hypothetical protein